MDVVSCCPLRVASQPWQPRPGSHALTVVCKATFELRPGESPLAPAQQEPVRADAYWNDDSRLSLRAANDMAPFKRRADVLVLGDAYAPGAKPTKSLTVRIRVGSFEKALDVHTDRSWASDGRLITGEPFLRAPLRWERAAFGTSNPVGIASNAPPDARGRRPIPNLMPRGFELKSQADIVPPMGFGPIAPTWYARRYLLGRYANTWDPRTWNTRPLPDDLDGAFFNAAPLDQQLAELHGDETIELEHLHAAHPLLTTRLAEVSPKVRFQKESRELQEVRLRIDTLCIDTDRGIATLVWRGVALLERADESGVVVLSLEEEDAAAPFDLNTTLAPTTAKPAVMAAQPVLPFVPNAPTAAAAAEETKPKPSTPRNENDDITGTLKPWLKPAPPVLPFQKPGTTLILAPEEQEAKEHSPSVEEPDTRTSSKTPDHTPDKAPAPQDVPKPAMLGPIAVAVAREPAPAAIAQAEAPQPAQAAPENIKPEPQEIELSLEQTATLAAELAEGKTERGKVLDGHSLREKTWRKNEARWNAAMDEEAFQGKHEMRAQYDAAYVKRVEEFRGPIEIGEYARIVAALERGKANDALDALKIQRPALMPIVRLWTKNIAKDVKLGTEARKALAAARRA